MKKTGFSAAGVLRLAANDFKSRYAGSVLGSLWAVAEPLVTVVVYWFVYTFALKQSGFGDVPYYLWLSVGLAAWLFIADGMRGVTAVFRDYSFLVKKMRFDISALPYVRLFSALLSHLIFIVLILPMCVINNISLCGFLYLPLPMLLCALFVYSAGRISALLCASFKDIQSVVSVLINIGFWITPIFWNSEGASRLVMLNPAAVIAEGYRSAILCREAMDMGGVLYVAAVCAVLLVIGAVYEKAVISNISDRL